MIWTRFLTRLESASHSSLRAALGTAVFFIMLGLISHGNYAASGDAVHYMIAAHSIAFDLDLDIGNDYSDDSRILKEPADGHARLGRNGVIRPVHDVGLPLVASPFFGIAYKLARWSDHLPASLRQRAKIDQFIALRQLVSILMILATSMLAMVFFELTSELTGDRIQALLWSAAWILSPPILSHGYVFLTEIPTALLSLWVYQRLRRVEGESPWLAFVIGLASGFLMLLHIRNIGLVLALVCLALSRMRLMPRRRTGFLLGLAAMATFKIALNLQFWGTIVTTPHARLGMWPGLIPFASDLLLRATGLLFDARHGLLPSAPLYLLVPAAWIVLRRKSKTIATEVLFIAISYLVFIVTPLTNVHGWRGGWSPAARFLVPIAPFLALSLPTLTTARRASGIAAVVLTIQVALDLFLWAHPMLLWSEGPGAAPWLEALIGQAAANLPSWEQLGPTVLLGSIVGFGMWIVVTWKLTRAAEIREPRTSVGS